ncbi:carboxymuconolactone decarboxylase family protein [Elioraea rosea]|uniref:carboxymuconolactone decarboxylase family protein n=1 Tax=Elioraea rosea TaxID=2492390 RepID=UPI001181F7BF|nr:carboxymuconolactone decarboxylase family protein [Elioraea rosea]
MERDEAAALVEAAVAAGKASFLATSGRISPNIGLLAETAPATFGGYGLMRAAVMRDKAEGAALDLRTKELIFVLLDVLVLNEGGAVAHLENAMRLGLTVEELSEGLTQVLMVGGITTWNRAGAAVMRRAVEIAASKPAAP